MDRYVHAGLGMKGSPNTRKYIDFTLSLWHLECAGKPAPQQGYARRNQQAVAPQTMIRAIECMLYRRGKRRLGREA